MKEKDEDEDNNEFIIKDLDIFLKENLDINKNNLFKEPLNENDINNFSEILDKIKISLEQINQLKKINNRQTRKTKTINNIIENDNNNISNRHSKVENTNLIISLLNKIIYLFSEKNINEENKSKIELNDLSNLLKELQICFYSNAEILKQINLICGIVINNLKDSEQIKIFLEIMIESLNYNDNNNNSNLIIISLKFIYDILKNNNINLMDNIYDITIPKIYNILNLSKNNDSIIQIFCYKILTLFTHNNVYSFDLVSRGLLFNIKEELEEIKNNKNKNINIQNDIFEINTNSNLLEENNINNINNNNINNINNINNNISISDEISEKDINEKNVNYNDIIRQIYILLKKLIEVNSNALKISDELMENLLNEFLDDNYSKDQNIHLKINFFELLIEKEPKSITNFVKYDGIKCILKFLKMNENNKKIILKLFNILNRILVYDKSYNEIVYNLNFQEYIKQIMGKIGNNEKEIDFKGKSILFLNNFEKEKLEEIEECDLNNKKLTKIIPPKPEAINFLNNGRIVKVVNNLGEIKSKYLFFTQDLMKVMAKKIKSTLPPKQKYIIDTMYITSVVKGYGTDVFAKSKRFYRKIPDVNKCFSIIEFHPSEGYKSINVICQKENEVDKWVNYIKEIITYFQENNRIQRNIIYNK